MLLLAPMLSAHSRPAATAVTRRAVLATSAAVSPLLAWHLSASAADAASVASTLRAASRESKIDERKERELLDEMRKIKRAEEMEAAELRRLSAAQENRLALATNVESPERLAEEMSEDRKALEADEREIAFIREEYKEGMAKLRKERSEVLRRRPTSAIDRLRLKQD